MTKVQVTSVMKVDWQGLNQDEFGFCTDIEELFLKSQADSIQIGAIRDKGILLLNQIDDMNKTAGKVLEIDSSGKFTFWDKPTGVANLKRLSDVDLNIVITSSGDSLKYDNGFRKPKGVGESSD